MKNQAIINNLISSAKTLGAWLINLIIGAALVGALWLALWIGYDMGLKM